MMAREGQEELEAQFAQWRHYVQRRRELQPSDAEELEDHLRGCVDELVAAGLSPDEAFLVAVKRMGSLDELSGGELDWTEGLLYPLLHRLERLGYVESSWQSVTGERRRKYYRITDKGLAELVEQRRQWDTVVDALKEIWLGLGARGPLAVIPLECRA